MYDVTLGETTEKTAEVSTTEMKQILEKKTATVFDSRPAREYAVGHIPGALNVAAKPGVPISVYVSDVKEIERTVKGDKGTAIVLYCNGPFCHKSKRLAAELLEAGFTNVRRYQLGMPTCAHSSACSRSSSKACATSSTTTRPRCSSTRAAFPIFPVRRVSRSRT